MNTTTPSLQEQLDDRDATIHELQERLQDRTSGLLEALQTMGLEIARLKRENQAILSKEQSHKEELALLRKKSKAYAVLALYEHAHITESQARLLTHCSDVVFFRLRREQLFAQMCRELELPETPAPLPQPSSSESGSRMWSAIHRAFFALGGHEPCSEDGLIALALNLSEDVKNLKALKEASAERDKLKGFYTEIVKELGDDLVLQRINKLTSDLRAQEVVDRTFRTSIGNALDQTCAPTHHPDIGAPHLKPMMPQERIDALHEIALLNQTHYNNAMDEVRHLRQVEIDLRKRCALLDWIAENVGNIDFHVQVPSGVMSSDPWIALGSNFEACIAKARSELDKATATVLATQARPDSCTLAPDGWKCTRHAGHVGPCAAEPSDIIPSHLKHLATAGLLIDHDAIKQTNTPDV